MIEIVCSKLRTEVKRRLCYVAQMFSSQYDFSNNLTISDTPNQLGKDLCKLLESMKYRDIRLLLIPGMQTGRDGELFSVELEQLQEIRNGIRKSGYKGNVEINLEASEDIDYSGYDGWLKFD